MDKQAFISLINKYYLDGIGEKVKWEVKDKVAIIKTFSQNKDMVGVITGPVELPDSEFVIFETSKFLKLVGICSQFIQTDINFEGKNKVSTKLLVADQEYNLEYALANLMLAPQTKFEIKDFDYHYSFKITNDFISKWSKAKKALNPEFCNIKLHKKDIGNVIEFTLGEVNGHSNKIIFEEVPNDIKNDDNVSLQFNTEYLKSIFDSNKESEGILLVNNDGAMKLEFENKDLNQNSQYVVMAKV